MASMPDQLNFVSDLIKTRQNLGAYDSPFSGTGVEFEPVWTNLPARGIVLHEGGHGRVVACHNQI